MSFVDVAVPELNIGTFTYEAPENLKKGARVIVEVRKFLYVGFILGLTKNLSSDVKIKPISGIIDDEFVSDYDLWNMALWTSKTCLCGVGNVLRRILPNQIITGEKIVLPPRFEIGKFSERNYFNPFDNERVNFFVDELKTNKRTLILFSRKEDAAKFFNDLPDSLKSESVLWQSMSGVKAWNTWNLVNSKKIRIVIGSQNAVFAPLSPEKIIVDDEANPSYIFIKTPNISARTLAGVRAFYLGAEFITAGSVPSLSTFKRTNPIEKFFPERNNVILADMFTSKNADEKGIEGHIKLTFSLLKRTKRELIKGRNVLWIFDRLGESSEVFCENCGQSIKCENCGHVMRSEDGGNILICKHCGHSQNLPEKCGNCGYKFFSGKRPGIEAIEKIAKRFLDNFNVSVYTQKTRSKPKGLIISTRRGLELCEKINFSLIAWLDLDFELSGNDYNTRLKVFKMLWDSYWKGRNQNSDRKILIQARSSGIKFADLMLRGWSRFFPIELKEREEYNLPPYGFNIEFDCDDKIIREKIIDVFERENIFVMDPGDLQNPLTINENSTEKISVIFNENFSIRERRFIKITIRSE